MSHVTIHSDASSAIRCGGSIDVFAIEAEAAALWAPGGDGLVAEILKGYVEGDKSPTDRKIKNAVSSNKDNKPKKSTSTTTLVLAEPEGLSFCHSTTVSNVAPARLYADWLNPAFHKRLRGIHVDIRPEVGGTMALFDDYRIAVKRLIEPACIELEIEGKALKRAARAQIRFEPLGRTTSKLVIYFWGIPAALVPAWTEMWSAAYMRSMFDAYAPSKKR